MWSLCPASPGFWNCNFPVTLPESALKLAHKNRASLEPAQVQDAGNSFCVSPGYYLLCGNKVDIEWQGVCIVHFPLLSSVHLCSATLRLESKVSLHSAWDARVWKIKVPGRSFHIFCLLTRARGVFPSTTRNPKQISHSREISVLQHSQGFHFKQTSCSGISEGFAQSLSSMHSWTACDWKATFKTIWK